MTWSLPPIPSHWATTTLDQIADVQGGITLGKKRKPAEKLRLVPYLRVANVQRGRLDLQDIKEVEATEDEIRALRLQNGDLLMNEGGDRDKLGRGWVWNGEIDECIHQNHVFRIRLQSESISPEYLSHFANTVGADYFSYAGKHTTGLASINRTKLCALPVALPPAKEQRRIVERLQELGTRTAAVRSALDAIPPLLDRFRQSVLAAAFRGDLTADWRAKNADVEPASELLVQLERERRIRWEEAELEKYRNRGRRPSESWRLKYSPPVPAATVIGESLRQLPRHWKWASLDELSWHSGYGTSRKCSREDMGVGVLRIPNIVGGSTCVSNLKRLNEGEKIEEAELNRIGDLLVIRTNGSLDLVGRCGLVADGSVGTYFASYLIRFRLLGSAPLWNVIRWVFESRETRLALMASASSSAGQHNVNLSSLGRILVPVPPQEEQEALFRAVENLMDRADAMGDSLRTLSSRLSHLQESILSRAFRGELVPQDPDDEPATVLLERIRAEREAAGTNGKPGRGRRKA